MRSFAIPPKILKHWQLKAGDAGSAAQVKARMQQLLTTEEPEVSVVIPAYNEEESIVQTLSSLSDNKTDRRVEIIVVDNNSKDRTAELIKACGVRYVSETTQGITPARNRGLAEAKGKYILNADADSVSPTDWIDEMVKPLDKPNSEVALT